MTERNVGNFIKENNALFAYLKDSNGNRIGVILAVKGELNEPKIGFAFFPEVTLYSDFEDLYEPIQYVKDCPNFLEELRKTFGELPEAIENVKLPSQASLYRLRSDRINKLKAAYLARDRANYHRDRFYVTNDSEDNQYYSTPCRASDESFSGENGFYRDDPDFVATIRRQIRSFEYRALRYFKYIPGLKETSK